MIVIMPGCAHGYIQDKVNLLVHNALKSMCVSIVCFNVLSATEYNRPYIQATRD